MFRVSACLVDCITEVYHACLGQKKPRVTWNNHVDEPRDELLYYSKCVSFYHKLVDLVGPLARTHAEFLQTVVGSC